MPGRGIADCPPGASGARAEADWLERWAETGLVFWLFFFVLILVFRLFCFFRDTLNLDVALEIFLSERLLDGGNLYTDYIDLSPPMIHYLGLPAAYAAKLLSVSSSSAFYGFAALLCLLSLILCQKLLRQIYGDESSLITRRTVLLALTGVFFIWRPYEFGQRDQLFFVLAMPYVWAAVARSLGQEVKTNLALVVGVLAGIGLGIKPYFPFFWIVLAGYVALVRRDSRELLRPENLAIAALLGCYGTFILIWERDYLDVVKLTLDFYWAYTADPLFVLHRVGRVWLVGLGALWLVRLPRRDLEVRRLLFIAVTALLLIALAQRRAETYHLYPGEGAIIIMVAVTLLRLGESIGKLNRYVWQGRACLAVVLVVGLCLRGTSVDPSMVSPRDNEDLARLTGLVKKEAGGKPIYVLSTSLFPAFPLVNYSGARWPYRFPFLMPLAANYRKVPLGSNQVLYHGPAEMSRSERLMFQTVVSDLRANPPVLLIVDEGTDRQALGRLKFDFLDYFDQDEDFVELMTRYRLLTKVNRYAVYKRQ